MAETPLLTVTIKNKAPVELIALADSLDALGKQYISFASSSGVDPFPGNVRLYIEELRTGSIVAVLKDIVDQASFVHEHRDLLAAFAGNFNDLMMFFAGLMPSKADDVSRVDASNIARIVEPVARDGGSQLFVQVTGDNNTVIVNNVYTSERARAAQEGVRRFLGPPIPSQGYFEHELLFLHQVRGQVRAKAGDFGIIEKFSDKPVKLVFTSDDAKRAILDSEFPFKKLFIVSGQISTAGGAPALYKIYNVHDVIDRP